MFIYSYYWLKFKKATQMQGENQYSCDWYCNSKIIIVFSQSPQPSFSKEQTVHLHWLSFTQSFISQAEKKNMHYVSFNYIRSITIIKLLIKL